MGESASGEAKTIRIACDINFFTVHRTVRHCQPGCRALCSNVMLVVCFDASDRALNCGNTEAADLHDDGWLIAQYVPSKVSNV